MTSLSDIEQGNRQSRAALMGFAKFSERILLVPIMLLCVSLCTHAQTWSGIVAPGRAMNWSNAGVQGGIPSASWTQCGSTIAAYSGSPSTIINALNSCGNNQYVLLGPGTFTLSGAIIVTGKNNVALRGSGANATFLNFSGASTCQGGNGSCLVGFQSSDSTYPLQPPSNVYNWTAGYAQGTSSITLSSTSNITPNSTLIVLDQCDTGYSGSPCAGAAQDNGGFFECSDLASAGGCSANGPDTGLARAHRYEWEIVTATAVSGNTVTITPPLQHPQWSASQTPQAWLVQPCINDGIENLSVNGAGTNDTAGVSFNNCLNGWVSGVRVINSYNIGIWIVQSAHMTVQNNYVYNAGQNLTYPDPTGIKYNGSNNLIQNNIIEAVRPFTLAEGPSNGSVIAYNFGINSFTNDDFLFGGFWEHSTGDDYNLFEGNVGDQLFEDQIHGSHLMETAFRNFFTGWESCAHGQCGSYSAKDSSLAALDDLSYNRYMNVIGNVLGTPGITTQGYTSSTSEYITGGPTGWVFIVGSGNGGGTAPIPLDPVVGATLMRWGNYDVFNGATRFLTSEDGSGGPVYAALASPSSNLPPSLYLSGQPSWWGSTPWPAIGPDVSGGNLGQCAGTPNTSGGFAGVAALSGSQCGGASLNSAWGGHANAIPAMACALNIMGMPPDGSGSALAFDAGSCYGQASSSAPVSSQTPAPPTNLTAVVNSN